MDRLGKLIESITKPRFEEDCVDRLNYRVSSHVLLIAAFTIIAKEYGGNPIQCWMPAEMALKPWEEYAEDYCFAENTYYVPLEEKIPYSVKHRKEKELTYYQWTPFMLLLQALMFTVPHIFWRMLNWTSGVQTRAVITMAHNAAQMNSNEEGMKNFINGIVCHLHKSLKSKNVCRSFIHSNPLIALVRMFGDSFLSCIYIITKLLFIGNAALQCWILSVFLGNGGFEMMKALMENRSWQTTGFFPRVTMCDFRVRGIGNRHHHTVQCVLMANMFNEKIFVGLWWWILILTAVTMVNLAHWIYIITARKSKHDFLLGLLRLGQPRGIVEKYRMETFECLIGNDGALVLRLMVQNAGEIITSKVAAKLFEVHCDDEKNREKFENTYERLTLRPPLRQKLVDGMSAYNDEPRYIRFGQ